MTVHSVWTRTACEVDDRVWLFVRTILEPFEILAYLDFSPLVVPNTFGKTRPKSERMAGMLPQIMPTGTSTVLQQPIST